VSGGGAAEPAVDLEAEDVAPACTDELRRSEIQPSVNSADITTEEPGLDVGCLSLASEAPQQQSQLPIVAPATGTCSESPAVVPPPQNTKAAPPVLANNTQQPPVEVKGNFAAELVLCIVTRWPSEAT